MKYIRLFQKYTVLNNRFSETKMNRLRKIIISAMGQSQRCYLPIIHDTINFEDILDITKDKFNKIVYYEHTGTNISNVGKNSS